MSDIFKQSWHDNLWNNSQCTNYRIFKDEHKFENYLVLLNDKDRINICKFRCRSFSLPISIARFQNEFNENCVLCDKNVTGDEFHYMLECDYFNTLRENTFKSKLVRNTLQFHDMFNDNSAKNLKRISNYLLSVYDIFKPEPKEKKDLVYSPVHNTKSGRIVKRPIRLEL